MKLKAISTILFGIITLASWPVLAAESTCPITPTSDGWYWQRMVAGMPYQPTISAEAPANSLPVYRGPARIMEKPLPAKYHNLSQIFPGKRLLFFSPNHEGSRALIASLNSVSSKLTGMAVGVSLAELQAFLQQTRPGFLISIAPVDLPSTLGINTLPALVEIREKQLIVYEGSISAEHVGGRE